MVLWVMLVGNNLSKADSVTPVETSVAIVLSNGTGTAAMHFVVSAGQQTPDVRITLPAVSASGSPLPGDITSSVDEPAASAANHMVTVTIGVSGAQGAAINTPYSGKIVLLTTPPTSVPFTVTRASSANVEVSPATAATAIQWKDSLIRFIRIRNTGSIPLGIAKIDSLGFVGSDNRYYCASVADDCKGRKSETATYPRGSIAAGSDVLASVTLPEIDRAGTYTGAFEVDTDSGAHQTSTFTVTARGPYARWGVPLILFLTTVVAGYFLALKLENRWSEGAVERLEAERRLRRSRAVLVDARAVFKRWTAAHDTLIVAPAQIEGDLTNLNVALDTIDDVPLTDLPTALAEASRAAAMATAFRQVLEEVSQATGNEEELKAKAKAMDAVPRPEQAGDYVKQLIVAAATTATPPLVASGVRAVPAKDEKTIQKEIARIKNARNFVLFLLAVIVAAQLHYLGHPQFGSASDYIAVFLWALGLTQAGAQLVARVRSTH